MIERIESGWPIGRAAMASGVSERTAHRWLGRYRSGDHQLTDRSSAPRRCPHRLAAPQIERIAQLRRQRLTGAAIARALGLARSKVGLVLRRLRLNRLARLEPAPPVIRYERQRPGEMIHVDIKKLAKINGIGHRFLARGPGLHANRGHGWDFLHVAIYDASRLAYTEILPSEGQGHCLPAQGRGLVRPVGRRCRAGHDRQWFGYRSKLFAQALQQLGARHLRTRPYTPRTNGKAERFIQSCLREWAYHTPYQTLAHRSHAAAQWTNA